MERSRSAVRSNSAVPSNCAVRNNSEAQNTSEAPTCSSDWKVRCSYVAPSSCDSERCNCQTSDCYTTEEYRNGCRRYRRSADDSPCCCGPAWWSSCGLSCCRPKVDGRCRLSERSVMRLGGCCCRSPAGHDRNRSCCPVRSRYGWSAAKYCC